MPKNFRINEKFFDEESEKTHYMLGAFYSGYIPLGKDGVLFRSRHKELTELVRGEMFPDHALISDNRGKSSYWVGVYSLPHLHSRLEEFGLDVPKNERRFPDINKKYLSYFIRGFLDAKAKIIIRENKYNRVIVGFNPSFLSDLRGILKKKIGTKGSLKKTALGYHYLLYSHNDSTKIHDFIYSNFDFIKENKLYVPSNKKLFNTSYVADYSSNINKVEATKKIERAKKLLLEGKKVGEVAKEVGYSFCTGFYRAFKKITGQTPQEYKKQNLKSR